MGSAMPNENSSIVFGPSGADTISLWDRTLGQVADDQANEYGDKTALVIPWQNIRMSFRDLSDRSKVVAQSILDSGLRHGDCVGIMAGNCYQYIEVFLGASRIGCPVVVLNNTYTPKELQTATALSRCHLLFLALNVGPRDLSSHFNAVCSSSSGKPACPDLKKVILLSGSRSASNAAPEVLTYNDFALNGKSISKNNAALQQAERKVTIDDVLNLQFTSGTTGAPKAAMLTHYNLINNGYLVGARMELVAATDVICCPPPLFHCFGLVMGFLGAFTNGCPIVFPCDQFDPDQVVDAVVAEKCTALLGVPTMFIAELQASKAKGYKIDSVRTGLAAGSPVPMALMEQLEKEMGITGMLIAYGMTETSPVTFMTSLDDTLERRFKTIGTVMWHTGAKIIDEQENIVPRGVPGEICTSGYALQKGYFENESKTKEVMKTDENGILWMYTGDQGIIDEQGYCRITGRLKDTIIRGGENIFPVEIEERLLAHDAVGEASVIAIPDERYGEVVGTFLRLEAEIQKPGLEEIQDWVRESLGRHKAPQYVFWIGDEGVGDDYPKTGSGKHQKHILRGIANQLLKKDEVKAKL